MKKDLIIISVLGFILFMLFAQSIPILDGDSAFYGTIAKNMVKSEDWMTLKFVDSSDIIDKPPFAMWMMAGSFKLFGINEFALSLWHALLAVGTIILTYLIGRETINRLGGILSAVILMLSAQFFYITRTPMLDIPLVFFITLSFYCFHKIKDSKNPIFYYVAAFSCAGALLTKGPVGIAIPALSFFIYMLITRNWKPILTIHSSRALSRDFLLSTIFFFFLSAPWFVIEYKILGQKFLDLFFLRNFLRFLRPTDVIGDIKKIAPQYDFYSYFIQVFLLFAPWSGFVYPAVFNSFKQKEQRLNLIWAIVGVCIFAFSLNYKIGRYILPAFPPLSIMIACLIAQAASNFEPYKKYIRVSAWLNITVLAPLLTIGTIFLLVKFPAEQMAFAPIALPFLCIFSLGIIVGTVRLFQGKVLGAVSMFGAFTIFAYMAFITCGAIYIDKALPVKQFCLEINQMAQPKDLVIKYKGDDPRQEYFYLNNIPIFIKDKKELTSLLASKNRVYGMTQDKEIRNTKAKLLQETNGYMLFSN